MKLIPRRMYYILKPSNIFLFFLGLVISMTINIIWDIEGLNYLTHPHTRLPPWVTNISELKINSNRDVSDTLAKPTSDEMNRIWFVTSTSYSLSQPPKLVRLAQALFPVRHFVTWIIVQETAIGAKNISADVKILSDFIQRFGIPFHIFTTNDVNMKPSAETQKNIRFLARRIGLQWIIQNIHQGVLMFAPEDYTYDHRIFQEVRYTKTISAWPVGLKRKFGLTSPLVSESGIITGYFDGLEREGYIMRDMTLDLGGYSVNINFIKRNLDQIWQLIEHSRTNLVSLGFSLSDVEPLAEKCTKIYVWRTKTFDHEWPKRIELDAGYKGTNIEILMKKVYGNRYPEIVEQKNILPRVGIKGYLSGFL